MAEKVVFIGRGQVFSISRHVVLISRGGRHYWQGVVFNNLHPVGPGALCPLTGLHEGDGDICGGGSSSLALGGWAQAQTDHLGRSSLFGRDVVLISRVESLLLPLERGHMLKLGQGLAAPAYGSNYQDGFHAKR